MSELVLHLLGAPRLERSGKLLDLDTRKAIALLAYLVVTQQPQARDSLAALLWPENDQAGARGALRRTLSVLNRGLGPEVLTIARESLSVQTGQLWVDLYEFHRLLGECSTHGHPETAVCLRCLPLLEQAAALYRDHFMSGFTLRDSPEFDDWQFFQTESLRREFSSVLERLVEGHSAQKQYEAAIKYARRRLGLDSLHEPAHRHLMELYARAGQRSAALRQYQECVRLLQTELGVDPLEETTHLYQEIKAQRLPAQPAELRWTQNSLKTAEKPAPPASPAVPLLTQAGRYPLVAREQEWKALLAAYQKVGPDGRLVVLEGEAGIGKTRLAEEFALLVKSQAGVALSSRCYTGEYDLALAPFLELLRSGLAQQSSPDWHQALDAAWLSEAARLLPDLARLRPEIDAPASREGPGAQMRFFEGVSQVLLALTQGPRPGILLIDDLQWADTASTELLTYLARRLLGRPLLILVTWRSEELPQDHRLRRLLVEVQRKGYAELLPLDRLPLDGVARLVEAAAGLPSAPPEVCRRLHQESEGVPFFLVEYLATLSPGVFSPATSQPADWSVPQGVRDLLLSRLDQVGETGRQLLQTAAVIGRSFDYDILREASGRSEEETVTTLETLLVQGLIREDAGAALDTPSAHRRLEYDFFHDKFRSILYQETSQARRRLLHQRVADALAGRARSRSAERLLAGQLAHHYQQAGRAADAAACYYTAGEHARSLYANAEARAHYQAALALGHPDPAALSEAIGDMHTLLGDYSQALASYSAAGLHPSSHPVQARLAHKMGNIHHRLGDWDAAESCFQSSLDYLNESEEAAEMSRLYSDWSRTAQRAGRISQAQTMAEQALRLAERTGDPAQRDRALAQAYNSLGILARSCGELSQAQAHLESSLQIAERSNELGIQIAALNNLALVCGELGEVSRALGYARSALELCIQVGDRHRQAALHNNLADLYHAAGQEETSMQHLKQAVSIFAEIGAEDGSVPRPEIWKLTEW